MTSAQYQSVFAEPLLTADGARVVGINIRVHEHANRYGYWHFDTSDPRTMTRAFQFGFRRPEDMLVAYRSGARGPWVTSIRLRWVPGTEEAFRLQILSSIPEHLAEIDEERAMLGLFPLQPYEIPIYLVSQRDSMLFNHRVRTAQIVQVPLPGPGGLMPPAPFPPTPLPQPNGMQHLPQNGHPIQQGHQPQGPPPAKTGRRKTLKPTPMKQLKGGQGKPGPAKTAAETASKKAPHQPPRATEPSQIQHQNDLQVAAGQINAAADHSGEHSPSLPELEVAGSESPEEFLFPGDFSMFDPEDPPVVEESSDMSESGTSFPESLEDWLNEDMKNNPLPADGMFF